MASSSSSRKDERLNESRKAFEEILPPSGTTSSPSTQTKLSYDVFINHRGCDTKETLAKDIYEALISKRVAAFLDNGELEPGDLIPTALQEVMNSARLHIAIFSPNYAESAWCLAELSFMLTTGKKIIPIFYNVQPGTLRWVTEEKGKNAKEKRKYAKKKRKNAEEKRKYASAFRKHEDRYSAITLQKWKSALAQISAVSGYIVKNDDDWTRQREKLVNFLGNRLKSPLLVSKDPLCGVEEIVEDFESKTIGSASDCAQIVGIVGMGGCGKTTLAKLVYNKRFSSIRSSFLSAVRDQASKNQLLDLQKKLLGDLGVLHGGLEEPKNIDEGMEIIASRLRSVSILLVLDDVDNQGQIYALMPPEHILARDSLIIITTRYLNVLTSARLSPRSIYRMKGLDHPFARRLFCLHAFPNCDPPGEFEDLVEDSLRTCKGLPLSLKVFGSQLCGTPREYWKSQLNEFSRVLPEGIKSTLRISYDALEPKVQELFLDISCFFIGERKSLVIHVSDGMGQSGVYILQTLKDKCLVELDQENRIRMHDHLRDLGRAIAGEKSPIRIWWEGLINSSLQQAKGKMQIRGLMAANTHFREESERRLSYFVSNACLSQYRPFPSAFCSSHFKPSEEFVDVMESSRQLKFLVVKDRCFNRKIGELSEGLVWLRWFDFGDGCLPSYLSLRNLRVLELYEFKRIKALWDRNPPLQLRELIIQGRPYDNGGFQCFPKSIGRLKHLQKLVICCTTKKRSFSSLPDDFCDLISLEHLELEGCKMLSSLPSRFGNLRYLRHVKLTSLTSLRCLPVSFKQLRCLQHLDLSGCCSLNFTPENLDMLENIRNLEFLSFARCFGLEALPHHITDQPFLRELDCLGTRIRNLPPNRCNLDKLEVMGIGSNVLKTMPPSFCNLSSLTALVIRDCHNLECLPSSFCNLSNLTTLSLESCPSLQFSPHSLERLNLLEELYMSNVGVESLPDTFEQLAKLRKLTISDCLLRELTFKSVSASSFCSLKEIHLQCKLLKTMSISEDCGGPESLDIFKCEELTEIETLPRTLKRLTVKGSPRLEKLPSLEYLTSLETLEVTEAWKVPRLAGMEDMRRLRTVELSADNISDLGPCIQTIKRWPCEMMVSGSAVDGAESIVADFTFPDLTILNSVAHQNIPFCNKWTFNWPETSSSDAAIICYLLSALGSAGFVSISRPERAKLWSSVKISEKGKSVWIGVFDSSTVKEYSSVNVPYLNPGVTIVKGMIAVGEEGTVQEVFKNLMLVLQGPQ